MPQKRKRKISAGLDKPKKILIVDDEHDIVSLLRIELEYENYKVVSAFDGEEGFSKYMLEQPDLIILDLMLPKLNGYEVCRRIRHDREDRQTPILMLTAKKEDEDRIVGRVMGAQKFITKPFKIEELLAGVEELLRQ